VPIDVSLKRAKSTLAKERGRGDQRESKGKKKSGPSENSKGTRVKEEAEVKQLLGEVAGRGNRRTKRKKDAEAPDRRRGQEKSKSLKKESF